MTIKEATRQLIQETRKAIINNSHWERIIKDKEIAAELEITPTSFSRIYTGVTMPDIQTWFKLIKYAKKHIGEDRVNEIVNYVLNTNTDT